MTERRKRNILIWILALLVICTGCLVFYDVFFSRRPGNTQPEAPVQIPETGGQDRPAATDTEKEDIRIRWREYTVYDFDDLGFRFIIANVYIEAEGPTNLTLDHFRTEEGIVLNDTASYVDALEEKSLYLGRQNVSFSLISVEPSYTAVIFIPVKDAERTSLTVSCDIGSTRDMKFQLVNAQGKREQLEYHADDVITDGDTYMMRVSAAYDITGQPLYRTVNGTDTDYPLASTTKVYAFKVEAVSLWGDEVVIESAEYIPSTTGEVFTALSSDIHSLKYDNILGRSVTENDMGYLFFYAYDPDDHPVTYHGVLKLKVRGSQRSISINVDLN
ncbi:MAG: hypothetical protein IIY52_05170 [Solobacterium sp.]|nr:hypothetical protein [Solobacterium sp.]MBQ1445814.1 hypothetical protein [Solobacterium sp.]